jgi:hypothetical protein
MNVIEIGEYETKNDAHMRENELMLEHKSKLNMIRAYRTEEQTVKYHKKYYNDNKETIKANSKKYDQENKEIKKAYAKKYNQDNKYTIQKHKGKKCVCECGINYTLGHKSRHIKSKKHQLFIQTQNQNLEIK